MECKARLRGLWRTQQGALPTQQAQTGVSVSEKYCDDTRGVGGTCEGRTAFLCSGGALPSRTDHGRTEVFYCEGAVPCRR
jgi:hypothetical protein